MTNLVRQPVSIEESSLLLISYHVVRDDGEEGARGIASGRLLKQLEELSRTFHFGTVADYVGWVQSGEAPHRSLCCLTFDDGLKGCIKHAAPLLLRLGIPATFYVCSGPLINRQLLDSQRVNLLMGKLGTLGLTRVVEDEERKLEESPKVDDPRDFGITNLYRYDDDETRYIKTKLNYGYRPAMRRRILDAIFGREIGDEASLVEETYMSESDVRHLFEQKLEVGCHFHDHEVMSRLNYDEQQVQTQRTVRFLSDMLGARPRTAAYPFGLTGTYNQNTKKILTEEGFKGALTTVRGIVDGPPSDHLEIPRFDVLDVFDSEDRIKIPITGNATRAVASS